MPEVTIAVATEEFISEEQLLHALRRVLVEHEDPDKNIPWGLKVENRTSEMRTFDSL